MNETAQSQVIVGHHKTRPYWHVDLKWLFGLLLTVVLGGWLQLLVAYNLTSPKVGIALTTNVLAQMFSHGDLDSAGGIDELKTKVATSPTKSIQPISGFPVTVTEQDLTTLSPRQLRLKLFGQIADPLYYKGPHGYAQEITNDPAKQQKFENDAALLGLITQARHDVISKLAVVVGVAVVLLLAVVVYFSAGFGRLVTPAVILLVVALPWVIIFSILEHWSSSVVESGATSETGSDGLGTVLLAIQSSAGDTIAYAQRLYVIVLGIGGILILAAILGKIVRAIFVSRHAGIPKILR